MRERNPREVAIPSEETLDTAVRALEDWYSARRPKKGEPSRTTIGAGLAVLERFGETFPLRPQDYITEGSQVRGASGPSIKKILARFGETRVYTKEGGRTSRGARTAADALVERLNAVPRIGELTDEERTRLAHVLQRRLTERATAYLDRGRLEVEIVLTKPTYQIVADILAAADRRSVSGPVAQHLVGAKLVLRYPDLEIPNHSATTADDQLGRQGDFVVGDTAIHVTVAPMPPHFDRCRTNLRSGYRALVLVPEGKLEAAKQLTPGDLTQRIGILPIEKFVGQNVEEIAGFARDGVRKQISELLRVYNARVEAIETDPGLLIDIPEL